MKTIKFKNTFNDGFFIKKINDEVSIISFGYSHLFNYPSILIKEVFELSKLIDKNQIDVYFDLTSVLGKESTNKYFVITYDKNKKDFIYPSKKTIDNIGD